MSQKKTNKKTNMKRYIFFITIMIASCNKGVIKTNEQYPLLDPKSKDVNAGDWKTIQTLNKTDFQPTAPLETQALKDQLNTIVDAQSKMSEAELENLNYWGAGSVVRWNEILRELVAKYNLPPVNNPDGSYPIPSAANPLSYPYFPFANPPYAARAYAYVSAAQYDALVVAYHWKSNFQRQPAYLLDSRIKLMLPDQGTKAYPSADAVVYGVSVAMLKILFPGEINWLDQKLASHKKARLQSGLETSSDLEAGEALGNKIAQVYIQRARGDRAGAAIGISNGVNLWKQFEADCIAINEVPWMSLDIPKRAPMLPYFGRVKPFLFDSLTLVNEIRPGPPPSTRSAEFKKELDEVKYYSQNPTRERIRIVHFWADGVGTYTPPGHWNAIAADEFVKLNWSEVRWARAMALLNMSLMDAAIACWDAKYTFYNPRPSQIDSSIKSMTGVPNFPAYVSGHSTFSGAAAEILGHLVPAQKIKFDAMAEEASLSRLYGAIHYKSDCTVGLSVGKKVGGFAIKRAIADGAGL